MSAYNPDHFQVRDTIKGALKEAGLTQGEFARRISYKPSTLMGKLNGTVPMDAAEEKKILADIAALSEGARV